jgi:protein ImuA
MLPSKSHIISRLQKEILLLQGFKPANMQATTAGLHIIQEAFPNKVFPIAAVHEFFCHSPEEISSSAGFISGILSSLMKKGGATLWISSSQNIFPPALKSFGIKPEQVIFIQLKKEKEKLWVIEEALKCDSISAVIGEVPEISFTESRRLQLAVEHSQVTAFLLRSHPKNHATACVTRWHIKPLASAGTGLPGLGFPKWDVSLLKVRNGQPGNWHMEWKKGSFHLVEPLFHARPQEERKIG